MVCCRNFSISHGGKNDVKRHSMATVHKSNEKSGGASETMASFMATQIEDPDVINAARIFANFIRDNNLSYETADHFSKLCKQMFPDSMIAQKDWSRRAVRMASDLASTKRVWRSADAVCFDVDSTLLRDEALDELAKFCGVGKEVQEWTNRAMGGGVSFRMALTERLNIVKPSRKNLADFLEQHTPDFSPRIKELIGLLQERNVAVYLVSGGMTTIIEPAAEILSIPFENIYANKLKFYFHGDYAGFDKDQPTSESGGKKVVVQRLKEKFGYKNLVMIGDGATDMEACPPADAFIGYGGNVVREKVQKGAVWFVTDFQELIWELNSTENS
ncbi:phosphoserine phosphatase-like isoform X2 [Pecten maximus]|uniref:phosphoserine phosphatase-like isoform X2 n=1 Tax=Pecten maximus TaxID=6579 RepID=UPI0014581C94|nr:phosphoserine phosphatase-like isoform X2 [Pecten maximus]